MVNFKGSAADEKISSLSKSNHKLASVLLEVN